MVIESMHEKTDEAMCKLLQALFRSFVITIDQMKNVSIVVTMKILINYYVSIKDYKDLTPITKLIYALGIRACI